MNFKNEANEQTDQICNAERPLTPEEEKKEDRDQRQGACSEHSLDIVKPRTSLREQPKEEAKGGDDSSKHPNKDHQKPEKEETSRKQVCALAEGPEKDDTSSKHPFEQ